MSLRRAGRMHHLGVGTPHARKRVLALADENHITVIELETGEVLLTHLIEPDRVPTHHKMPEEGLEPPTRGL
jgi:hypothetical protein